jgi:cysteinyl-tRNA synthetase
VHYLEISKKYEQEFIDDMQQLNVQPPSIYARVSDHMPIIIDFIRKLIHDGYAYVCPSGRNINEQ